MGIVLSGTGTDGTLGLTAIRAEGGLTLVQAPETAEFDGMPTSAIAAQAAASCFRSARCLHAATHVRDRGRPGARGPLPEASRELEQILAVIRLRDGHDFSAYKRQTLLRRIRRRMSLHRIEQLADYARYWSENRQRSTPCGATG